MSCLIYAHNGDHCTGKCDANCYEATGGTCDCICGGVNHGVGLKKAKENTAIMADKWIENYAKEKGIDPKEVKVNLGVVSQLDLF